MCQYQEASQACAIAARRAEYTALVSSQIAARVDDPNCQTVAEAGALIDEWVTVKDGLRTAEEVLTLVASNPEAWEAFCAHLNGQIPLPPARRPPARPDPRPAQAFVSAAIRAVRGF